MSMSLLGTMSPVNLHILVEFMHNFMLSRSSLFILQILFNNVAMIYGKYFFFVIVAQRTLTVFCRGIGNIVHFPKTYENFIDLNKLK